MISNTRFLVLVVRMRNETQKIIIYKTSFELLKIINLNIWQSTYYK